MELYDIVKIVKPFWNFTPKSLADSLIQNADINRIAIISKTSGNQYALTFLDSGSATAWWDESQIEFIKHGSKKDLIKAKVVAAERKNLYSNINWIKTHWGENMSATSILTLFDKIGFKSAFLSNGEYCVLFRDFTNLYPVFDHIFNKDLKGALDFFKLEYREYFNDKITALYNEVWS